MTSFDERPIPNSLYRSSAELHHLLDKNGQPVGGVLFPYVASDLEHLRSQSATSKIGFPA